MKRPVGPFQEIVMRRALVLLTTVVLAGAVHAQQPIIRSSNPGGVQVIGNTELRAEQKSVSAVAVGAGNEARNAAATASRSVLIQGNTTIKAEQKNTTAVAVGTKNKSTNEAGTIGGN
jgi:hypothetical protein